MATVAAPLPATARTDPSSLDPSAGMLLLLGIGNTLLGDDGVGVHVARELARRAAVGEAVLPARTRVVDGGTLGLRLLPDLAGALGVVFVDAVAGQRAGSVTTTVGAAAVAGASQGPLAELMGLADLAGVLPGLVALVGIGPCSMEAGAGLSTDVAAALPAACEAVESALTEMDSNTNPNGLVAPGPPHERGMRE